MYNACAVFSLEKMTRVSVNMTKPFSSFDVDPSILGQLNLTYNLENLQFHISHGQYDLSSC